MTTFNINEQTVSDVYCLGMDYDQAFRDHMEVISEMAASVGSSVLALYEELSSHKRTPNLAIELFSTIDQDKQENDLSTFTIWLPVESWHGIGRVGVSETVRSMSVSIDLSNTSFTGVELLTVYNDRLKTSKLTNDVAHHPSIGADDKTQELNPELRMAAQIQAAVQIQSLVFDVRSQVFSAQITS